MKAVTLEQNITLDVGTSGNGITEGGGTEDGTADGHIEKMTKVQKCTLKNNLIIVKKNN